MGNWRKKVSVWFRDVFIFGGPGKYLTSGYDRIAEMSDEEYEEMVAYWCYMHHPEQTELKEIAENYEKKFEAKQSADIRRGILLSFLYIAGMIAFLYLQAFIQ